MKNDVKSFLTDLKQVNDSRTVSIVVPSTNKKATFKRFSVTQHKQLIRAAFDGIGGNVESQNIFNKIIKDNCSEEIDFLLCDRDSILLELRKVSVGTDFKINNKTYNLAELKPYDITDIELTATIVDEDSSLKVDVRVPTLDTDSKINTKAIAELGKLSEDQQRKRSVEILLIYEIAKYIDTVKISDIELKFDDISIYEKVTIINELPMTVNNKIIDYITKTRAVGTKSLTFDDGAEVSIDAGFLSAD